MARELLHQELTGKIRQVAFETHCWFRNGFLEKVYENALELGLLINFGAKQIQFQRVIFTRDMIA